MTAHFEAKLHGFRRTQDGVVISYVIHPNDLSSEIALAPLGTRYMVAFAEIADDGTEAELARTHGPQPESPITMAKPNADKAEPLKERRPFASLPLSQQAAIRCQDNDFKLWIGASNAEDAADKVRKYCGVGSRSEIITGTAAADIWLRLDGEYQAYLTDRQYADARR